MKFIKKLKNKKLIIKPISLFIFLFIIMLLICNLKQKRMSNPPQEGIDLSNIPQDSQIIFLKKKDFPENLNFLKDSNNSVLQTILSYLKKDIVLESEHCFNEIIINIKPNLKFQNEEPINAQTIKDNLKLYIDSNLTQYLLDKLDKKLIQYIIENDENTKKKIFDNLFRIEGNEKIKIKLNQNTTPQQIIDYLNKKIFLFPSSYLNNKNGYAKFQQEIPLSYGEYKIHQFQPEKFKLWLIKNSDSDNNKKDKNIIYLAANKKEQSQLFDEGHISSFEPLEDIMEDISYDEQSLNKKYLANVEKYRVEFQLDDWQLFLIFNLTTKDNFLKIKIKEQLDFFKNYFTKNKENKSIIDRIKKTYDLMNLNKEEKEIYDEYNSLLEDIFLKNENTKDKIIYDKHRLKLDEYKNIYLPHKILQDKDFRKAFYFAFDREEIIKDIFPFYKSSCYPVSELSELHYIQNNCICTNLKYFLDLKSISLKNKDLIKEIYNEKKVKELFQQSWQRLSAEEQKNKIILKINYNHEDERFKIIFKYLEEKIKNLFEGKVVLKQINSQNSSKDIIKMCEKENLSSVIYDLNNDCDLHIDCYPTLDFNNIMFSLLTKFYCNEKINIDFSEELSQISKSQQESLKKCFQYSAKEFPGINEQGKLEGDIYLLNAFFYECNKISLSNEIKQKIILKLCKELDKKYFESLPAIPLFSLQKCIIYKNK